jgi:hypothetical protein
VSLTIYLAVRPHYQQDLSANPSRTAPTKLFIRLDRYATTLFKQTTNLHKTHVINHLQHISQHQA